MTEPSKIFLDTSFFIYLVESHPVYYPKIVSFVNESISNSSTFASSVLTYMEFCVLPIRMGRTELIDDFEALLFSLNINLEEITLQTSRIACNLRAKYPFLKGMDALQLSSAIYGQCDIFLTNDAQLNRIEEIKTTMINNMA